MMWELLGENCESLYHDGHLPLDWRTKAKALLNCDLGRYEAMESWSTATVHHGWKCWAPPGEWYGGEYITWQEQTQDGPEGWCNVGEHVWCSPDPDLGDEGECADRPDILCLHLERWDDPYIRAACDSAPPEVHLVTAGEGWPWLSRIIAPVTVVDL